MFNVIPQEEKKILQKEYNTRRLIVFGVFIVITLVISLILLFPSYLTSRINHQNTLMSLESIREELTKDDVHVATPEEIAALRAKISVFNSSKDNVLVQELFSTIANRRGSQIKILEMSFARGTEGKPAIIVEGNADTRDALTQFARNLQAEPTFSEVNLPISNLAKDKNIAFSMTMSLRP